MHLLSGLSQEKFANSWGIAIVSSPVFLVITYISLNPSSPFFFLCEVEFLKKCEFSHAKLLLKVHWLSLLKISASACGWSLPGPCPLALLNALCSFQPWHMLFFLSENPVLAFVFSNELRLSFIQEAFSGFHRPNQYPLVCTACTIPQIQHWFTLSRTWG